MEKKQKTYNKLKNSPDASLTRVVGIGASAGGLEALQRLFQNIPDRSGLAYVVVQHLSPDYKSMMDELLARHTDMKINIIEDGMKIFPDTVYLIPPRLNLKIFKNQLFLSKQGKDQGLHLPIDIFFRSLAQDKGSDAIGIILSGTGSDGTIGVRAIKEATGLILVQDEKTAKFNGMPSSAISTGLIDYVLPPDEMGKEILNYIKHPLITQGASSRKKEYEEADELLKIIMLLHDYSGIDFSYYKEKTINRRLERRISINRFTSFEEYLPFLTQSESEKEILYREFLIGVTHFFRDKEAFQSLSEKVFPDLFKQNKKNIRIWTTGCSTGEEAFSIAILLMEMAEKHQYKGEIKIFASDIDRRSIEIAGKGFYPNSIVADVEPELLAKYFNKEHNGYTIRDKIRNLIVFATHNVLKDPPFSKLDLLVCRNLFIYLKPEIQTSLLARFYHSLNPEGFLFMGSSETLGNMQNAFEIIDVKHKIFKYKANFTPPLVDHISLNMKKHLYDPPLESRSKKSSDKGRLKYEDLLTNIINKFLPPSVIIDANYLIIKVINDINPFSQIQAGHYSNELFSILPKDLGLFVNNFLRQLKNGETEHLTRKIAGLESFKDKIIELSAKRIQQENHLFFLVSFSFSDENTPEKDIKIPREEDYSFEKDQRLIELEKELKTTRENLAATVEELESANEELQSSNEELVASNEELQSTNEELQSVNEELYTVNSEHQEKIQELTNLNNDINNLLKNTEIAAIYLDSNLCIRKITPQVSKITNIIEADLGRPINHLTVMETYPEISEDAEKIMETLQPIDKEIIDNENKPYFVKLRPYRTENNAVEGIMITIIEITELKALQDEIQQSDQRLSSSLDLGSMAWWEYDVLSRNVIYDDRKATMLGYKPEDFPNDVYAICDYIHSDDYEPTMQKMRDVLEGKKDHWEATYRMKRKDGSYAWFRDRGSVKTRSKNGIPQLLIGMVVDISDYQTLENDLSKRKELLNLIFENTPITTVMVNSDGQINYANKKAEELFNITKKQIRNRSFNSAEWKITGLNHKPVDSSDLPFSIIKKSRKPVYNYQHYIKVPGRDRKLLTIDGAPVISNEEHFIGAVFTIKAE